MRDPFTRLAGRTAITYIVVASLWILFSDSLVAALFGKTAIFYKVQTLKGWVFVLFTGALLYGLMKRILHRIETVAYEDQVTGLPNRLDFTQTKRRRCKRARAHHQRFSLTIFDVDNFADLNDEQGHREGDKLLALLGQRLTEKLGAGWYVARLGGDEFGVLSPMNVDPEAIQTTMNSLQCNLTRADDEPLLNGITVSAGTSLFPDHGDSSLDLMRHADMALLHAKASGRDCHIVYRDKLKQDLMERIFLLKDLKAACDRGDFDVVYQPQWSVCDQCWTGVEVLVRWQHLERGIIAPDVFIPLAEKAGLIASITEFVVKRTLTELKTAGICRATLPYLSLNLSHPVLINGHTMDRIFAYIQEQGSDCPRIMMEITETAAMEDLDATLAAMQRWRGRGIEFSIDDFGTGYSSLSRLKQMPISELKIDRSFIQNTPDDQNDVVITKAILAMAQTLSLNVVAEGVETQRQVDFLSDLGCTALQGYFLARPMAVAELRALLLPQ